MNSIGGNGGDRCQVCGNLYLTVWYADDEVWTKVTGIAEEESGLWCPHCFSREARAKGITVRWSCAEEWPSAIQKDNELLQARLNRAEKELGQVAERNKTLNASLVRLVKEHGGDDGKD